MPPAILGLGHAPRRVWFTRPLPNVEPLASGGAPGAGGGGRRRSREGGLVPLGCRGTPRLRPELAVDEEPRPAELDLVPGFLESEEVGVEALVEL